MPPYLRLGSIPRKRHIVHPHEPGFKGEGIYYEEVVGLAGFSRATALPITCGRRRAWSALSRRARSRPISATSRPCGIITSRHERFPARATRSRGRVPLFGNDDVTLARCRPEQPQQELVSQCRCRRSDLRSFRPRHVAHDVRSAAVSRI